MDSQHRKPRSALTRDPTDRYVDSAEYDQYVMPSDENGATALQKAIYDGDMRAIRLIVERRGRAALKETDRLQHTALHTACYFGKVCSQWNDTHCKLFV